MQSLLFEKIWGEAWEERIVYAYELPNEDYILIGTRPLTAPSLNPGPFQIYMCRMDKNGNILWENDYGDPFDVDNISSVLKANNGTYLIVGTSHRISYDIHVMNLDNDGQVLFDKFYIQGYYDFGNSICATQDSCYLITCNLDYNFSSSCGSPSLIKIDAYGNEIWRHSDDSLVDYMPQNISSLPDSGCLVVGYVGGSFQNTYITRYASDGQLQWIKYPYGKNNVLNNSATGLFMHADCTFDITFVAYDPFTNISDGTHWKEFDSSGTEIDDTILDFYLIFSQRTNVSPPVFDVQDSMYISTSNPYMYGASWIMEVDKDKNYFFRQKINESDSAYKYLVYTIRTSDGGYLSVGIHNAGPNTYSQFYLVKFGPDGRYQAENFAETINAYPNPSSDGNITLTFDMLQDDNVQVDIFSSDGKLVYSNSIFCPANSHTELPVRLDLLSATGGMYILQARTSDDIIRKKIIVRGSN